MLVVSHISPLNYLTLIGCIEILPSIFGQVYAPPEVLAELGHFRSTGDKFAAPVRERPEAERLSQARPDGAAAGR